MFAENFKVINKYSSTPTNIFLIPIHSDDLCSFSRYYKYFLKKLDVFGDEDLLLDYNVLKDFFGIIRSTILPYDIALQEISMNEIGELFNKMLDNGVLEEDGYLKKFGSLIGKFFRNEIPNLLEEKLNKIYYSHSGKKSVISHFTREANQNKYVFNQVNRCLSLYEYYDYLFFLGTPSFYGNKTSVLKCSNAYFLGYDIYQSKFEKKTFFNGNTPQNSAIYSNTKIIEDREEVPETDEPNLEFDYYNFAPKISEEIKMKHAKKYLDDYVQKARMLNFTSNNFVFLPIGGRVGIINRNKFCVEQIPINNIEPGDWVVLRRSSDEEYIRNKAAQIVGSQYCLKLNAVTEYKELLKDMIEGRKINLEQLRGMFFQFGIDTNTQQIKEWIFGVTILPRQYKQILKFLGYTKEEITILKSYYDEILNAHKKAGRELSSRTNEILHTLEQETIMMRMKDSHYYSIDVKNIGEFSIFEVSFLSIDDINVESGSLYRLMNTQKRDLGGTEIVGAKYFK